MSLMTRDRKKPKKADGHTTSQTAIRLPEPMRIALKEFAEKNDRTVTAEIKRAILRYLTENGAWPPPEDPRSP
jgi:hypothetical protein